MNQIAVSIPERRIMQLCEAMGTITQNRAQAVDLIMEAINNLSARIRIPGRLSEMGLHERDIEMLSRNALKDISSFTNPRQG